MSDTTDEAMETMEAKAEAKGMFDSVETCLEALRRGEIIVVTDDADRENEGDCICAAEFATTGIVNFKAK